MADEPKIGLALSGGGSRAIAFHLGCLRALNELGVLDRIKVISTVSGGSVVGGLYIMHRESFQEFEERTRSLLARGLIRPMISKSFTTLELPKVIISVLMLITVGVFRLALLGFLLLISGFSPSMRLRKIYHENASSPQRRLASFTTILSRVLDEDVFYGLTVRDLPDEDIGPLLIVNAAELRTNSAFYFSSRSSGSWRFGELEDNNLALGFAVAASAAQPLLLPALDTTLSFKRKKDGKRFKEWVMLSDGGSYDNLGLAPLWPDRDPEISLNVTDVGAIICCSAGHGLRFDSPSRFILARIYRAVSCLYDRGQHAAMKRLFDLHHDGRLKKILLPYLGQNDSKLKFPPDNLITREETDNYPTNFNAMPEDWIDKLSLRGEQLTKALVAEHIPEWRMK